MLNIDVFKNPQNKYRPIPLWFWNGRLNKEKIQTQIEDLARKGLGGFFIHARFGLETQYLSHDWMDYIRIAIQSAEKLGLEVWLYDENGYPSGIGDLKVSKVPEYRPQYIEMVELSHQNTDVPDGEFLFASKNCIYLKKTLHSNNNIIYGVNYLNEEAMRYFFDIALEPYKQALGEYFGSTIKGIFTDEPTLLPWHHNRRWYGQLTNTRIVVWDDSIEEEMIVEVGLSEKDFIPHLFHNIDKFTSKIRKTFWDVVCKRYIKSFFEPYKKWCTENNLIFTGHLLLEEGLYNNTIFQANPTKTLEYFDIPGVDHLGDIPEYEYGGFSNLSKNLTNIQGQKIVTSLAHITDKNIVMSETYGCAGWGLNFKTMKKIADWQYTLGINMLIPHAMYYSIEGFRKFDAPASHNHLNIWSSYKIFADYIGRLSYAMRAGKPSIKVALVYPLSVFQEIYEVGKIGEKDKLISDTFDLITCTLPALHIDYDIISETNLTNTPYKIIIVQESAINAAVETNLKILEQSFKTIIRINDSSDINNIKQSLTLAFANLGRDVEIKSLNGDNADALRYTHRKDDDSDIYFIANTSDNYCECNISLSGKGIVERWDLVNGNVFVIPVESGSSFTVDFQYNFHPLESAIFVVYEGINKKAPSIQQKERRELCQIPDEWIFEAENPNIMNLDKVEFIQQIDGDMHYIYKKNFDCEYTPKDLSIMLDNIEYRTALMGSMDIKITVNDKTWNNPIFGCYIDDGFKTLNISEAITAGKNNLTIDITHSATSGEPQLITSPIKLIGSFSCLGHNDIIAPPVKAAMSGSITDFGYPYYTGTCSYSQTIPAQKLNKSERVFICIEKIEDMAEILINGKSVGVILWNPWEIDITDYLTNKRNHICIKITNSMDNIFQKSTAKCGLLGKVKLVVESVI